MNTPPPITLPAAQWAAIKSAHATPPRAYHDFSHVRAVLRHYDEVAAGPGWTPTWPPRASTCAAALRTASGAARLKGPEPSVSSRWTIAFASSSIEIHGQYWAPVPIRPASPSRNGIKSGAIAPRVRPNTMEVRMVATLMPALTAGSVLASHWRQISGRCPAPGPLVSVRISSPRSP